MNYSNKRIISGTGRFAACDVLADLGESAKSKGEGDGGQRLSISRPDARDSLKGMHPDGVQPKMEGTHNAARNLSSGRNSGSSSRMSSPRSILSGGLKTDLVIICFAVVLSES